MATSIDFWKLGGVGDTQLLSDLGALLGRERRATARVVAYLAEVEERRLHLTAAASSLFDYCVNQLGMREDEACRRIEAARLGRRFPEIFRLLDTGQLSLSVVGRLKPFITQDNSEKLLALVSGQSVRKTEALLAEHFPSPDVACTVRKLPTRAGPKALLVSAPTALPNPPEFREGDAPTAPIPTPTEAAPVAASCLRPTAALPAWRADSGKVDPLAPGRYRVQFTASSELTEKFELARDLMRHQNPKGDLAPIVERALDLLIEQLMKRRFGQTTRPGSARNAKPEHVSNAARRGVLERDGLRCTFEDEGGRRCGARAFLELDHRKARGKGGDSGVDNLRLLCRNHNQLQAEQDYGRAHVERARTRRRKPPAPLEPSGSST